MEKLIKGTVAVGVLMIMLSILVIPNFSNTQGDLTQGIQSITTSSNWNDVINTSASQNFTVSNDTVTLTGTDGFVQTEEYSTSSEYDTLEVNVSHLTADTDVTLYDGSGTQLDTVSASGDETVTLTESDYTADGYYVEFDVGSATDSEIDSYEVTGSNTVDSDVQVLIYLVLLLFLIGLGLGLYTKHS